MLSEAGFESIKTNLAINLKANHFRSPKRDDRVNRRMKYYFATATENLIHFSLFNMRAILDNEINIRWLVERCGAAVKGNLRVRVSMTVRGGFSRNY